MSVEANEILSALEALEVARFKLNALNEVVGLVGLGDKAQPTIVVGNTPPDNNDGRPDGTLYIQVS